MKKTGRINDVSALLIVVIVTGCQATREPNRDVNFKTEFYMGQLTGVATVPIGDLYRASEAALRDLGVDVKVQEQDGLAGQVLAADADGDTIMIDLEAMPGPRTSFSIRVGWANKNKTQIVFNKIKEHLSSSPWP
jgi:hypothetical protein